jgi:site-specific DNA-methyltransferase (adenine-specific)
MTNNILHHSNCLPILQSLPDSSIDLICTDPPFASGKIQKGANGCSFDDRFTVFSLVEFLRQVAIQSHRILATHGTLYMHLDYHSVHYVKVMLDEVFGYNNFLNEIIWSYDYGWRGKFEFPKKHDNILSYTKEKGKHVFEWESIDRIPYLAPGLQKDKERAVRGKVPTDVWWSTIVPTNGPQRTGYPTQKPIKIYERMITASSKPGMTVLDPFAGSGTTLVAASHLNRSWIGIDQNPDAIKIIQTRLDKEAIQYHTITNQS